MKKITLGLIGSGWMESVARAVLAAAFILAALSKLPHPQEFSDAVAAFRILPIPVVNSFAIILPGLEVICGLAILPRATTQGAALLMIVLNTVFMIAAASAMARGLDIKCGCFTISRIHDTVGWGLLFRDAAFIALCLIVLRGDRSSVDLK